MISSSACLDMSQKLSIKKSIHWQCPDRKKKQKKKQCTNHYLGFQSFHLHHLLQKKWEVSSAKSLIWVNRLLQVPFIY